MEADTYERRYVMVRTISIGAQRFEDLRVNGNFYIDKTGFIRDWWRSSDEATLICRPRRFGKTLNLDTVRCFFSTEYAGRGEELFGGLEVWNDPEMRALQGTVPVVSLSFANVKQTNYADVSSRIAALMTEVIGTHRYLFDWDGLSAVEREQLEAVRPNMDAVTCAAVPHLLCSLLHRYHGVKPIVLLDEYDAPMQEAWLGGFWDEASAFMRDLMNSTFKTNEHLGRALITGVTRVSRESIFSDLNNLSIVTTSTPLYQTCFGFTEAEVFAALDEYGLGDERKGVRAWYDGFEFDGVADIYNPWSICEFLRYGEYDTYWANTSGNGLVSSLVREGDEELKEDFEILLNGGTVSKSFEEQVVFSELEWMPNAVWSLLVASGYVKPVGKRPKYVHEPRELALTNYECQLTFDRMIKGWFRESQRSYSRFVQALLAGDARMMTRFLNEVLRACASSFDGGKHASEYSEPERFYHGLVLGLLVELRGRYAVESNRESGYGRYDVMLVPNDGADGSDPAIVVEFKVFDDYDEPTLEDTVARAKAQIEDKAYATALAERGFAPERIHTYGMAFRGKECLVG